MKRLVRVLFLIALAITYLTPVIAQQPTRPIGAKYEAIKAGGILYVDSVLYIPVWPDTSFPVYFAPKRAGALMCRKDPSGDTVLCMYTGQRWKVIEGSGVGSPTAEDTFNFFLPITFAATPGEPKNYDVKLDTSRAPANVSTQHYADSIARLNWSRFGNSGTTPGTHFIGNIDDVGLMGKVNNTQAFYIDREYHNTSFGYRSLISRTDGDQNTAVGINALEYNTTGSNNTGVGYYSLNENNSGTLNTAVGMQSLQYTTGIGNVGIGASSGNYISTLTNGNYNTLVGYQATTFATNSTTAIALGYQASAATNQFAISPNITEIKTPGVVGADIAGYVLTTNGSGIATFQAAGGNENLNQTVAFGNTVTDNNIIIEGDDYGFTSKAASGTAQSKIGNDGLTGSGYLSLTNENGFTSTLRASLLTSDKYIELPAGTGTLALENSNTTGTAAGLSATLVSGSGGTGFSTYTTGDLIYASATNTLSKLGIGTAAQSLKVVGGIPAWRDTLAVSGVYLPIASPTFTGSLTSVSGSISIGSNINANAGIFTIARIANNNKLYWNSGPVILGNTNDITFKNAAETAGANISIGTAAAAASAILDITSTVKGVLLPRMTTAQRDAISSPAAWLQIICTDCTATDGSTGVLQIYNLGITTWKNAW